MADTFKFELSYARAHVDVARRAARVVIPGMEGRFTVPARPCSGDLGPAAGRDRADRSTDGREAARLRR